MGKYINGDGYIMVYIPNHHFAKKGCVPEHRLVWEKYNQAILLPWSNIHHINGDRKDNRIENLEAMMKGEHTTRHNIGTRHSEETKRNIGLKSIGRMHSEEDRRKISEAGKKTWETRNRHFKPCCSFKGRHHSEECKKRISESVKRAKQVKVSS